MSKYVIKNCPANNTFWGCRGDKKLKRHCKDITNCLLKQIVNELKNDNCDILNNGNCFMYKNDAECCNLFLSKKILGLLEIEEVDEQEI